MGKVLGRKKLKKKLLKIPDAVREEANWAHYKNGQVLTDQQRQWVPKDSGHLRDKHRYEVDKEEISLRVWVAVFYASFQEFGTSEMTANPWFYPAYRVLKRRLKGRLTRGWRKGIKKAIKSR